MKSLSQINKMIAKEVSGLTMYKGNCYFYFDSVLSYIPNSIMVNSVKDITVADIESAIASFKEALKEEGEPKEFVPYVIKIGRSPI